ncbi:MAG: membrane protein insertion efficiency factor YidD [Clostridia bacterium]|nr:membrane protein insertion efficiency factor YidD [Clostridia bacterium]
MKYVCIYLIRLYQHIVSPLKKTPCCRFNPTCSHYAMQAFEMHGFFGGIFLSLKRVIRCNPFCKGGDDPVPEKIEFKARKNR